MSSATLQAVYSASKAGLIGTAGCCSTACMITPISGLTLSLAQELGPRNIRVNLVNPGQVLWAVPMSHPEASSQVHRDRYDSSAEHRKVCTNS